MTKKEIVAKLTELGIEFDEGSNKADLEALLPEEVKPMVEVEPEEPMTKKALREIYAISKANNPERYAAKNRDAQLAIKLSKL